MSSWILAAADAADSPHAGGKARALARAQRAGLPVPPWFVLSAEAFAASLTLDERIALAEAPDPASLVRIVEGVALSFAIAAAVAEALRELSPDGEPVAVRSSASDEDGTEQSFAGQLESFLNVPLHDVPRKIAAVWSSGFSERILAYRREHGLGGLPPAPAVLIQRMVSPRTAGVAFGADPVSGRRGVAVVSAVPGFGSALVSGDADADTWLVDRTGAIVERRVVPKRCMHVPDLPSPEGVRVAEVPADLVERPALTDAEVREVAALAGAAGGIFGRPQDIEWAFTDRLLLLQSRPITSLDARPDPDARLAIWDNSNIVESYSGVTTPLTFSFTREIYEHVYRQFCRMMGVPGSVIDAHQETFENMLGLVRGRLFYNLLNWYRVLAMLPGYQLNRSFMEQMMGVKEPLPEALAEEIAREARGRALDAFYSVRTAIGLVANHMTLNRQVDAFYARLDEALAAPAPPLDVRRIDELVAHYRDLRQRLLLSWDAPLINDFFAMVFYGQLRTLVIRWCGDPGGTLQNDLIGGDGGIVSAEPAVRMQRLARLAAASPSLTGLLASGSSDEIRAAFDGHPEFARGCRGYLEKFGDRTINELKLESVTLHDDPLPLFRAIGALARQQPEGAAASPDQGLPSSADRLRRESRRRVKEALAGHPARRALFGWILKHAQRRVRDRENLRLERTRLFGRVRRIFLEIGRQLRAQELLDDARDVFYLEVEEVLAFVDGRATTTDLRGLVTLRRGEFREYAESAPPDDRFETHGPVYHGHDFRRTHKPAAAAGGEEKTGLGCCPGVVRGPVRVVTEPTAVDLSERTILVAEHTDPGWIMVFPSARGLLVERGSLLSHAAIVARELGIPAVVSLPGVTRWLRDGDWVEMDGSTGVVRRIRPDVEDA